MAEEDPIVSGQSEKRHSLGTRTLHGMAWAYGAYFGGRMLVLVSTAILARLLTPADFGVVAIALLFMTFLDAIKDFGLGNALILSYPGQEAERAQTVFAWTIVIGLGLSLGTCAIAPLISSFFHEPTLTWMLAAIGANFTLRALGSTHYAIARKELNYRVRTVSEIAEVTVRGFLSIGLAIAGLGAWSLTLGFIAGVCASTLSLWYMVDFRPKARLARNHLRDLLKFGGALTLVDIGATLIYNLDYIFVGRVLGAAQLGLYTIGFRLPELAILNLANVAADVLFPAYSSLDQHRLTDAYLMTLRYIAIGTLPVATGLIILARPVTLVAFGPQWTASIPVMQVITLYTLAVAFTIPSGTIFKVTGRARLMVIFTVPAVFVLAALLALFAHEGIATVAWATTGVQAVGLPLTILVASRQLRVALWRSAQAIAPAVASVAPMVVVLLAINAAIGPPVLTLLLGIPAGAVTYLGLLLIVSRDSLERLRSLAFPGRAAVRS